MQQRSVAMLLPLLRVTALLAGFPLLSSPLAAQARNNSAIPPASTGNSRSGLPGDAQDEDPFRENVGLRDRLERSRAIDRQRRIVDDANRLVTLTAQYRKSVEAHGTPSIDDQKLLVQIEKLARDVKDRMRGM